MADVLLALAEGMVAEEEEMLNVLLDLDNAPEQIPARFLVRPRPIFNPLQRNYDCKILFRFDYDHILLIKDALRFPPSFVAQKKMPGLEALCVVLNRLAYPKRYIDQKEMFGRHKSDLSTFFNIAINFMFDTWAHIMVFDHVRLTRRKLEFMADRVFAKGRALDNIWGFIDGTVMPICRPKENQNEHYNGHKRVHAVKFQGIMAADGIISHLPKTWDGPMHDSRIFNESGFRSILEAYSKRVDGKNLALYGDRAYELQDHLVTPFRGDNFSAAQELVNARMSRCRIAVEWGFGKVCQQFAFIGYKRNLNIGLSPTGRYYIAAVFLTNIPCLNGSQTSTHFGCPPPALDEYLTPFDQ
jgi:hypothetical protein